MILLDKCEQAVAAEAVRPILALTCPSLCSNCRAVMREPLASIYARQARLAVEAYRAGLGDPRPLFEESKT